ncbi:MAG: murein biosynthesis integral membrane protein MurJ [Chloroflexi bacterium]|nr:murein biosynthesis integral membrane protein MurJ [Chloroflexota bacterium]
MNSPESNPPASANRQIARAAGTVMVAIVLSQVVGLVAKSLVGSTFGTGAESEAFFAANRFSEIIFNLVAGGALASAFIPTFTGLLAHQQREKAWELASAVLNLVLAILVAVSLVSAVFAPALVRYILAPGFDAEKQALTVQLLRVQLPSAAIFGISGLCMGILNAHQSFLLPALAPSMYSFGWIFGTLVLAPRMGIFGLAWGAVIGSAFHFLIQLPMLTRLPARRYHLTFGLHITEVREVARLMGPRLLGVAVVQLNFLLNTILSSSQPQGSLSGLSLAFPLMIMPEAAIAQAIAIAALPTFSAQVALHKLDEMRGSLAATLRSVLLLAVPATFGLILLREPLVRLVYMRNEFDETSLQFVSWALLWYAVGLVGHSLVEITARAFYALHDTKTPVFIGIAAMSLNLAFSLAFSALFRAWGWMPHGGLALANSLATALEAIGLLVLMRRRLNGIGGREIGQAALQSLAGAAVMSAALLAWLHWTQAIPSAITTLGGVVCGGAAYLLVLLLLKPRELALLREIPGRLLSRVRR